MGGETRRAREHGHELAVVCRYSSAWKADGTQQDERRRRHADRDGKDAVGTRGSWGKGEWTELAINFGARSVAHMCIAQDMHSKRENRAEPAKTTLPFSCRAGEFSNPRLISTSIVFVTNFASNFTRHPERHIYFR